MMTRTMTWGMWTTPTHIHSREHPRARVTPCTFYDAQAWGPARHTAAPPTPTKYCAANTPNASTTAAGSPPQPKRSPETPPDTASTANWNRPSSGRSATNAGILSSPSPSTPPGPTSSAPPSTGVGTASPATSPWSPTRSPPTGPPTRRVLSVVGFPADAAGQLHRQRPALRYLQTEPAAPGAQTATPTRAHTRRTGRAPGSARHRQTGRPDPRPTEHRGPVARDHPGPRTIRLLDQPTTPRPGRRPRQRRLPSSPGQVRPEDSSAA